MNLLSLTTNPTEDPLVFDTCWMTGLIQKGRVRVTVPRLDDGRTAAELASTQYLLTVKNVCGHNKAGAGLVIRASSSTVGVLAAPPLKGCLCRKGTAVSGWRSFILKNSADQRW